MKELDILGILKLAILVKCTLVGVILRRHIKVRSGVMIPMLWECSFGLLLAGMRERACKEEGGQQFALTRPSTVVFIGESTTIPETSTLCTKWVRGGGKVGDKPDDCIVGDRHAQSHRQGALAAVSEFFFLLNSHRAGAALSAWTTRVRGNTVMPVCKAKVEIGNCRMESMSSKAKGDRKHTKDDLNEPIYSEVPPQQQQGLDQGLTCKGP